VSGNIDPVGDWTVIFSKSFYNTKDSEGQPLVNRIQDLLLVFGNSDRGVIYLRLKNTFALYLVKISGLFKMWQQLKGWCYTFDYFY
jgi:hypothetical protein